MWEKGGCFDAGGIRDLKKGGDGQLPEKTFSRQAKGNAKTVEEEYQYRLRQFYRLMMQADKRRMVVLAAGKKENSKPSTLG